jgi:glutathione S-transferase
MTDVKEHQMSLIYYFHPLSSYCQKVLIALYENDTPFTPRIVNLMDEQERAEFRKLWPVGKFPVLRDEAKDLTLPESTIIIEYLGNHYPGPVDLVPRDPDAATRTRLHDRFYDLHVHDHMQKIVGDRFRPADKKDSLGVAQAKERLDTAYHIIDQQMASKTWATGESYSMADCAASPALFYANLVHPFAAYENLSAYFDRLSARPSFARCVAEAKPYIHMFPKG